MPSTSIKLIIIYLVALLGVTPAAWAGPAEEVAAVGQQTVAALEKGDIDAFIVAFADNAVFTPSVQAFRVEGKAAIKAYFSTFFETYPTRHDVSQPREATATEQPGGTGDADEGSAAPQ